MANKTVTDTHRYMNGFGNDFESESLPGALPVGRNSPQKVAYGLYAEQLSGAPFTAPRHENRRTWLYRIRPAVLQPPFRPVTHKTLRSTPFDEAPTSPDQLRWDPMPMPDKKIDFIDGLFTLAGNGDTDGWSGLGVHLYAATASMKDTRRYFYDADGELLIVPQQGTLVLRTELGVMQLAPGEIAVIPRGMKFAADFPDGSGRGYICENYGYPFMLPERGPIGANGLANGRDFMTPVAAYEDEDGEFELVAKFAGSVWRTMMDHSPLDIVAWHGTYVPYKYDLARFNTINTVSFDHPDPSIFTVLTSPSYKAGTANVDFAIFPPRWMVATDTFRPPYFHRNLMSECMGLIHGVYDAKEGGGFAPGGCSIHNCMSGHGPDASSFGKASTDALEPHYLDGALAFMFESRFILRPTKAALESKALQRDYSQVWASLPKNFNKNKR